MAKQAKDPTSIKLKNAIRERAKALGVKHTRAESVILRAAIVHGLNAFERVRDGEQLLKAAIAEEAAMKDESES